MVSEAPRRPTAPVVIRRIMVAMIEAVLTQLDQQRDAGLARMRDLLSIPSVSTDPSYRPHIDKAADWIAGLVGRLGASWKASDEPFA